MSEAIDGQAETGSGSTALAIIPIGQLPVLIAADEKGILGQLAADLKGYEPDASTPKGREKIGSMKRKVEIARADFDRLRKKEAEGAKKTIEAINAEWKIIEKNLDIIQDQIEAPRIAYLAAEKARITANEAAIAALEALTEGLDNLTPDEIKARHESIPTFEWSVEFQARAEKVQRGVVAQLQVAHQAAKKREAEALIEAQRQAEVAEYERLAMIKAQQLREEQIARDATEAARIAAEAEAARKAEEAERAVQAEREAAAERERGAAEALALAEAERLAGIERERVAAEMAEAARVAAHESALADLTFITGSVAGTPRSSDILQSIALLQRMHANRNWEEFTERATKERADTMATFQTKLESARNREAREVEAQRIERERVATEEAERRQRAAIEAERKRVADETARQKAEDDRRAANKAHQGAINRAALAGLMPLISKAIPGDTTLVEALGRDIITAIAKGEIQYVAINYAANEVKEGALL